MMLPGTRTCTVPHELVPYTGTKRRTCYNNNVLNYYVQRAHLPYSPVLVSTHQQHTYNVPSFSFGDGFRIRFIALMCLSRACLRVFVLGGRSVECAEASSAKFSRLATQIRVK